LLPQLLGHSCWATAAGASEVPEELETPEEDGRRGGGAWQVWVVQERAGVAGVEWHNPAKRLPWASSTHGLGNDDENGGELYIR
jgi:hypothetical protein